LDDPLRLEELLPLERLDVLPDRVPLDRELPDELRPDELPLPELRLLDPELPDELPDRDPLDWLPRDWPLRD
jgi:hypothetical protein